MMPSSLRFLFVSIAVVLAAGTFPATARADESEGARLFREGRALMLAERFVEACPKLEQSQRIEPHGGTLLNVAACHERIGRIATAWAEFHDALVTARTEGHAARARLAEQRLAALEPRVPWLTITVTVEAEAQGVRVTFDGAEIQRVAWGKDMPIDPGEHVVLVTAAGRVEQVRRLVARASERQTIEVTPLAAAPDPAPDPAPVEPAEPAPAAPVEPAPPPLVEPARPAPRFGRWALEVGLFGAYMNGTMDPARPGGGEDSVQVTSNTSGTPTNSTCYQVGCTYALGTRGSFVGGASFFAGYAARDWIDVGGRVIMGPRLHGGMLFATGPSVSLHVWGPLWIGASVFLGYASQSEKNGQVTVPPPYYLVSSSTVLSGSTDVAVGAGLELRADLMRTASGALSLGMQPLFLAGSRGSTFVLPFAVAYRWR